jgi:Fe-S-cluster containining protein
MQPAGLQPPPPGGQDVARGLNPAKPIGSRDMVALMRLLDEKVRTSVRHRSVDPLMEFVYSSLTDGARFIAHIPVACGKGCSFCCRMWVDATPPEVLYTVKKMPPEQRQQAQRAVERACIQTSGADFFDRCGKVNPPCPLLDDGGACSVYDSRPIACRTLVSTNVDDCKSTFMEGSELGFPSPGVWFTLRDSYNTALEGALIHAGLVYQARELNDSLRIAMTTSDAEARWLSGADDFGAAGVCPAPPLFEQPLWRTIYQQAFGSLPF